MVFADELIYDASLFSFRRQHFPSVGFHLEVRASSRMLFDEVQSSRDVVGGVAEEFGWRRVERDVKVNAPFWERGGFFLYGRARRRGFGGERVCQIWITADIAVRRAFDDLVEINVVCVGRKVFANFGRRRRFQGRTEMNFADWNFVLLQAAQGFLRIFKLHGHMAAVVVNAQVILHPQVAGAIFAHLFEESDGFLAGFQVAKGFGFQAESQFFAGAAAELLDVVDAFPQVFPRFAGLSVVLDEVFVGNRHRAYAAVNAVGN